LRYSLLHYEYFRVFPKRSVRLAPVALDRIGASANRSGPIREKREGVHSVRSDMFIVDNRRSTQRRSEERVASRCDRASQIPAPPNGAGGNRG